MLASVDENISPILSKKLRTEPNGNGDIIANATQDKLVQQLISIHGGLSSLPNLHPAEKTNALFTELVHFCVQPYDKDTCDVVFGDERMEKMIRELRNYGSIGEKLLELFWANKMTEESPRSNRSSEDPSDLLNQFPYYQNYIDLTRLELNAIKSVLPLDATPSSFAFLGSGPMPLTSICLAQLLDQQRSKMEKRQTNPIRIHNVDNDPESINLSKTLVTKLGVRSLTFELADAGSCDLNSYDVVYLAAMVGLTKEQKFSIIASIASHMRPGALLIMRSAHGMRQILYPAVDPGELLNLNLGAVGTKVEPVLVVHPWNSVVNSVIIAKIAKRRQ